MTSFPRAESHLPSLPASQSQPSQTLSESAFHGRRPPRVTDPERPLLPSIHFPNFQRKRPVQLPQHSTWPVPLTRAAFPLFLPCQCSSSVLTARTTLVTKIVRLVTWPKSAISHPAKMQPPSGHHHLHPTLGVMMAPLKAPTVEVWVSLIATRRLSSPHPARPPLLLPTPSPAHTPFAQVRPSPNQHPPTSLCQIHPLKAPETIIRRPSPLNST